MHEVVQEYYGNTLKGSEYPQARRVLYQGRCMLLTVQVIS
jgi:hypothetical protein